MRPPANPEAILFDFTGLPSDQPDEIVQNISGVAVAGDHIWTVSDEHHSLQCFAPRGKGYALAHSFDVKDLLDLPKFRKERLPPGRKQKKEADLEGLAVDGKYLWFCGAHCRARRKPAAGELPDEFVDKGLRRHLLGRIRLTRDGLWDGKKGQVLPVAGPRSLRAHLAKYKILAPFLELPAKENGFDIEGIARRANRVVVGLRGPVIAGRAVTLDLTIDGRFELTKIAPQFLSLSGLAIRDLFWDGRRMLILAGPATSSDEPFIVFEQIDKDEPKPLRRLPSGVNDHPEAITLLKRNGRSGLLMLSDGSKRANGLRYSADWYPL